MENYSLKPGVSFCHVAGRILFLDLERDRYFCLAAAAERSFGRLAAGDPLGTEDHTILTALARRGPVRIGHGAPVIACPRTEAPTQSLLDLSRPAVAPALRVNAGLRLATAPLQLRLLGMERTIGRLQRRKSVLSPRLASSEKRAEVSTAYAGWRTVFTTTDQCLPRSLAVAHGLLDARQPCTLILGVKLLPFAAHAWVTSGDVLVNDRFDVVRDYAPILVV